MARTFGVLRYWCGRASIPPSQKYGLRSSAATGYCQQKLTRVKGFDVEKTERHKKLCVVVNEVHVLERPWYHFVVPSPHESLADEILKDAFVRHTSS